MKLTTLLSLFTVALGPSLTQAAPVPAPQGYASYGDYAGAGASEGAAAAPAPPSGGYGSYGSYSGAGAAEGAAAQPAPPSGGGYGSYGSYPAPEGGYGSYKRSLKDLLKW